MKTLIKNSILILLIAFISSCEKDDDNKPAPNPGETKSVITADFFATIDENPLNGTSLGFIEGAVTGGTLIFHLISGQGIAVDHSSGEVTVADSTYFDYSVHQSITGYALVGLVEDRAFHKRSDIFIKINQVSKPLTVQQRLGIGETPFQIYQSDNSLLDSLYGKNYGGGLIFYLNTSDGSGLLATPIDQGQSVAWDTTKQYLSQMATGATSYEIGDGASNTQAIVNTLSNMNLYAAKVCDDLTFNSKSDWFLPSANEMEEMRKNLSKKGYGNFAHEKYWTSTEFSLSPKNTAIYSNFDPALSQISGSSPKIAEYYVRAARAF